MADRTFTRASVAKKLSALSDIAVAADEGLLQGVWNPYEALQVAAYIALVLWFLTFGIHFLTGVLSLSVAACISLGIPSAVFGYMRLRIPTWNRKVMAARVRLDQLLAQYEPLNKDTFQELQTSSAGCAGLQHTTLFAWINAESAALHAIPTADCEWQFARGLHGSPG